MFVSLSSWIRRGVACVRLKKVWQGRCWRVLSDRLQEGGEAGPSGSKKIGQKRKQLTPAHETPEGVLDIYVEEQKSLKASKQRKLSPSSENVDVASDALVRCYIIDEQGKSSDHHWVRLVLSDDYDVVKAKILKDFEYNALPKSSALHINKDVISRSAFGSLSSCMSACKYTPRTFNLCVVLDSDHSQKTACSSTGKGKGKKTQSVKTAIKPDKEDVQIISDEEMKLERAGLQCYSANTIRTFISSFEEVTFVREGTFGRIYVGEVRHQKRSFQM